MYLFSGDEALRKLMPAFFVTSVNLIAGLMAETGCGFDCGVPFVLANTSTKVTMANASLEGIGSTERWLGKGKGEEDLFSPSPFRVFSY
ncbi:MAG: hypothetical protein M3X11_04030 [Acidobacteriota bacterium]|nr:hypothetical protein [Acidobacteriota bacterium]